MAGRSEEATRADGTAAAPRTNRCATRDRRSEGGCVFVRREDAFAALEDALGDEPDWSGLLYVAPIELDERDVSAN